MRKGEKIYLIIFIALFVAYVIGDILAPKPVNWTVTFSHKDKNPFGTYILNERSEDIFKSPFSVTHSTIAEIDEADNLLILADGADVFGPDLRSLLNHLNKGSHVLIGANQFSSALMDTLAFEISVSYHILDQTIFEAASSEVILNDSISYSYPFSLVSNYFELNDPSNWTIHGQIANEQPIIISREIGEGRITLCSTPYVFTNFGLLVNDNYPATASILSLLPEKSTHFTLFYHLGKAEATTPFRYFLRQDALRWSLYMGLFSVLVFLIISSRRNQRPIPVISPPDNSTINYVKTLGALFYSERDHKKAALRLISHFLHRIKEHYNLSVTYEERFYKHLSTKSGVDLEMVIKTFERILFIRESDRISEETLIDLTKKIERFK
ncbi:DUF4350 domain-containing protein [Ekhidna sp.]|uniref:DUF4350 domain-containing protein n=1 Tax=Ekhidna sp. TaxID=2608089 RepID=UPI003B504955